MSIPISTDNDHRDHRNWIRSRNESKHQDPQEGVAPVLKVVSGRSFEKVHVEVVAQEDGQEVEDLHEW